MLFGSDVANAQPVFMKYLYMARKRGADVAVVNPFREPGLERYWVPSNAESAIFGTKIANEFFPVHVGGDIAFLNGVLKVLIEDGGVDLDFVREHTAGWDDLVVELDRQSLDDLSRFSGASVDDMRRFALLYAKAKSAVLVWSMGITQHVCGTDNVQAIVNLALTRGNVGRPATGLMPIRGHSGVQGGAEMGAYATVFPGGVPISAQSAADLEREYGFAIPTERGLSAAEMIEAAERGEMDVLWSSGGNFLDTLPDPHAVRRALESVPLRVHQDIVVTSQMLVDGQDVLLLPTATRYEQEGGGTETTTERRVAFSPEIPHPKVGEVRSEWRIFRDLAVAVDPERAADLLGCDSGQTDPRGDRPDRPVIRGHPAPGQDRRRDPVGWRAPLRWMAVPDCGRQGAFRRRPSAGGGAATRTAAALDATRQAVQLDGLEAEGPAHGRPAGGSLHFGRRRHAARAGQRTARPRAIGPGCARGECADQRHP